MPSSLRTDLFLVKLLNIVVLPECEVLPAIDCPVIGDLNNPGGCRSFAGIEELCLLKE
jgi:hypothetical protein